MSRLAQGMLGRYQATTDTSKIAPARLTPMPPSFVPKLIHSCVVSGFFSSVASARLRMTSTTPLIPRIAEPGNTKISRPIRIKPRMKSRIARVTICPASCDCAQK